MARSPFQGTFQPNARPTVATAPDAVVHINGEAEIAGCPQCARKFDLNKYITSIQTDLSIDSVPGSANISLAVPRHAIDDFYFDGTPVITTMMEVEIYAKGHFLVEGMPQYYPIFWGLVTEVQDNYSGGEHTVSIHCADILKWWELCKTNINPAVTAAAGDQGRPLTGNVFSEMNAYDIIYTLASQSFGDVLIGAGSVKNYIRDTPETNAALTDMTLYWEKRFSKMRSNLVLYGTSGVAVRGDTLFQTYSRQPSVNAHIAAATIRKANGVDGGQMFYDPSDEKVVAHKTNYGNAGPGGLTQSEYQTKLELAVAAKESIGFEFFMDVTGDIVFKPPFYNLDVLGNKPLSWIQDIDVIDWDFSESESEVVTQIIMQGDFSSTVQIGAAQEIQPHSTVTDYHLLRKYGWRTQNYNAEFMTNPLQLFQHGLDVLDRINSRRHRGNVTIPMRSELRLGFPIYLAPKDQIWYVSGISHSIQFGGRASTTLQLTSRRTKFIAPRGIGELKLEKFGGALVQENQENKENKENSPVTFRYSSRQLSEKGVFRLKRENALEIPASASTFDANRADSPAAPLILRHPKTGRIVGYPNVTMVYSRPFSPDDVSRVAGQATNAEALSRFPEAQRANAARNREVYEERQQKQFTPSKDSVMHGKYLHNAYQYGMNAAGVFIYAHDSSGVIREALTVPTGNVLPQAQSDVALANPMTFIRPVSDERGFEVIGHYQYGRRVSLRDGRLIVNGPEDKAKIDVQLALSGELSTLLTAQSQGLTTVVTGYADPAAELAVMTPDDRETAAAFPGSENSPNRRTPVFTKVGDEYVDDAPLGSPEQRGVAPSVEASQLTRALSLAEMAVKDGAMVAFEECVCLTGRADLAFMSSDYQVKTLSHTSASDLTSLGKPSSTSSETRSGPIQVTPAGDLETQVRELDVAIEEAKKQANDLERQQVNAPTTSLAAVDTALEAARTRVKALEQEQLTANPEQQQALEAMYLEVSEVVRTLEKKRETAQKVQPEALPSLLLEAAYRVRDLEKQREIAELDIKELQSQPHSGTGSIFTQRNSELIGRVERFLFKLYSTLDDAHQQYEGAIRGDLMPKTNSSFKDLHQPGVSVGKRGQPNPNAPDVAPVSEFAPPFSAPDRFRLGDPNAAVGSAQSNVEGLAKTWSNFSEKLQDDSQRKALAVQVSQDRASIARLTATRDRLIKQRDSSTVLLDANVQKQIDSMTTEIAKLEKQVVENQLKSGAK